MSEEQMAEAEQTWQTIFTPGSAGSGALVMAFGAFFKDVQTYEVRHPFFAPAFLRATDLVIRAALSGRDAVAKALCGQLFPFAHEVANAPPGTELDVLDTTNLAALSLFVLAEGMSWTEFTSSRSGQEVQALLTRLSGMTRFSDGERETIVLAMLLHVRADKARYVASLAPLDPFFGAFLTGNAGPLWPALRDQFPNAARNNTAFWHQLLFAIRLLAPKDANPAAWLRSQVG
jgi:hypothetical protein